MRLPWRQGCLGSCSPLKRLYNTDITSGDFVDLERRAWEFLKSWAGLAEQAVGVGEAGLPRSPGGGVGSPTRDPSFAEGTRGSGPAQGPGQVGAREKFKANRVLAKAPGQTGQR